MGWFLRVVKSRIFLAGFAFLLLVALVLTLGAWLAWPWTVRLLGVIVVLLLCLVVVVMHFARANRSADEIERSIRRQAEQQFVSARPDRQAEIQDLQRQLEQAIERLKQSKLGRGRSGRAALYALPWYLFVGPPGAGKTTAILNSGLNFPIGVDRVRGVGGTRNCDWFFTDQAILLDTAGRYMTEQEDTEEWFAFLDTLKQHRTERPINGVLVGIALPDLATATPDEVEWHADTIRRRVDELIARLGVSFPVYLVFTKCDMLQGFVEFFGEMTRKEREEIWGSTLDEAQQHERDLRAVFEREFDLLVSALVNRRTARLSRPMKREERQKVYAFPLQFASVKENLALFVGRLFQPNPYQESPIFRGVYFTSGTQEGIPLDRVIQAIAQRFDLPAVGGMQSYAVQTETKSYFIKDLFTEVVVPDRFMARSTSKARRAGSVRRWGVTAAAVAGLALFLLVTSQALVRGKLVLNETHAVAAAVGRVPWGDPGDVPVHLARQDRLHQQVEQLERTPWLGLGLYRNGTVLEPTRRLYLENAQAFVRAYPLRHIDQRMRTGTRGADLEGSEREALTNDLMAYLLVTDERARLAEENNRNFLVRHLTEIATGQLEPHAAGLTRAELQARIEPQVAAYVAAVQRDPAWAFAADADLIRAARLRIDQPPSIEGLYDRIRREGRDALPPVRLEDMVGGPAQTLLVGTGEVPGMYTKRGWEAYVREKIAQVSRNPSGEDWVMGRSAEAAPAVFGSQEQVAARLEELYFTDYALEWTRFLQGVRVRPFENLRHAARALSDLGNTSDSPIAYVLARVTDETRFQEVPEAGAEPQAAGGVRGRVEGAVRSLTGRGGAEAAAQPHPVDRRFQALHSLRADRAASLDASPNLYGAFESLREAGMLLDGMAGDAGQTAAFAAEVLQNGGDLDRYVRNVGSMLHAIDPEVRRQLFEAPLLQAWAAVLGTTQAYLNERWQQTVYQPFQASLAGRYPFDPNSASDALLTDVERFFHPQSGAVARFLAEDLEPYTGRDVRRPKSWRGYGIRLSPAALETIERARGIGEGLFQGGMMGVAFQLQADVPQGTGQAPIANQVSIRLLGREYTYDLGVQRWESYQWPGAPGAVLTISTQVGDLAPKRYEGDWALFRLLRDARITPGGGGMDLRWTFDAPGNATLTARYTLRPQSSAAPFRDPLGFFSVRPPATLQ